MTSHFCYTEPKVANLWLCVLPPKLPNTSNAAQVAAGPAISLWHSYLVLCGINRVNSSIIAMQPPLCVASVICILHHPNRNYIIHMCIASSIHTFVHCITHGSITSYMYICALHCTYKYHIIQMCIASIIPLVHHTPVNFIIVHSIWIIHLGQ